MELEIYSNQTVADRTNEQEQLRQSKRQALDILKKDAEMKRPRGDSASGGGTRLAKVKQASETESMHTSGHRQLSAQALP